MFLLQSCRRRLAVLASALALAVLATSAPASDPLADSLTPRADLTPAEVVRIQLEALRRNDASDRGIAVAFRFASPSNKRSTGPLPRFASMIKAGPYALMLNFTDATYGEVEVRDRVAAQPVTLSAPGQRPVTYVFFLSRQSSDDALNDCWMTDAVNIVPYKGEQA